MQQQKRLYRLWAMLLLLVLVLSVPILAAYPTATDYISDPENVLSDTTKSAIKTTNETLYANRGVQIGVCVTPGTGDESITEFSRNLFSKWEMCDGVLLVLDTTNQTYFAVQSVDVDDVITNAVLSEVLSANTEADFVDGNVDRAVMKTVTALSQTMTSMLPDPNATTDPAPTGTDEDATPTEADKPSGFVTFMKVILWIIVILVVLAVGIFVVALFNEELADFLRTYVFRRGPVHQNHPAHPAYYDDRLYGNQRQPNRNGQRRPQGQQNPYREPQRRQGNGSQNYGGQSYGNQSYGSQNHGNQNGRQRYDPYNDYDMQYQYQGQRQNGGQQRRPQQNGAYPRQNNGGQRNPNQNGGQYRNPNNRNY